MKDFSAFYLSSIVSKLAICMGIRVKRTSWRQQSNEGTGEKMNHSKKKFTPWLYHLPAFILIGVIVLFPILYTGYISLTNMNLYHWQDYTLVGADNYVRALGKIDSGFLTALWNTVVWTVVNMVLDVGIAYILAVGLNAEGLRARRLYKTLIIFPWAMPAYVSILAWRVGMYNTEFGLLNKVLMALGFEKVDFLSRNIPAFLSCMVLNLWMSLPYMIVMFDGALQSIDRSMYESAVLDGAGAWQRNVYITIPSLRRVMAPVVIMTTFTTFKQFDIVYLLTMQKGSVSGSTMQTIITYAHQNAFVSNNYGLSSAVSVVIFVLIIIFSIWTNRVVKSEGGLE